MVLLCMLAGVLCYGVAVNVGWCCIPGIDCMHALNYIISIGIFDSKIVH